MRIMFIFLSFYLIFQFDANAQINNLDKLYYAHIDKELYLPDCPSSNQCRLLVVERFVV